MWVMTRKNTLKSHRQVQHSTLNRDYNKRLPIHIDTGRFNRKTIEQHTCNTIIFENGEVENEEHFLLKCEKYNLLWGSITENPQFNYLKNCEKRNFLITHLTNQTAKFVKNAYDLRHKSVHR